MTPQLHLDGLSSADPAPTAKLRYRPGQRAAARAWAWPRPIQPSVWIEDNIVLPSSHPIPGPYRFAARPWGRRFADFFGDPTRQEILGLMGSQMGKSLLGGCIMGWGADTRPGSVLWMCETDTRAEEYAEDKLIPIFQSSPRLASLLRQGRDAVTKSALRFRHGTLRLVGAGSKSAAQGRSPWMMFIDEYEKCMEKNKHLGSLNERALMRILTWGSTGRLAIITTPLTETEGSWPLWESSQQWLWRVPCPKCGARHPIEFEHNRDAETGKTIGGIRWPRLANGDHPDPDALASSGSAWYECPACLHRIDEAGKARYVLDGSLECVTPDRPDKRTGMRVPGIASPDTSWSAVAAKFLRALGKPGSMVTFRTETLCLPTQARATRPVTIDSVRALRDQASFLWGRSGPWELPPIPDGVQRIYVGIDAQRVEFWAVILGLGYEGEVWNLWSGRLESKDDLRRLANTKWQNVSGRMLWPSLAGLDTGDGNRTDELYRFIANSFRIRALKGSRSISQPLKFSRQDFKDPVTGQVAASAIDLCIWHTTTFQDKLQGMIDQGPGAGSNALHLPDDVSREYVEHLMSERRVERVVQGRPEFIWEPITQSAANHMRDATCMALVAAAIDGWACTKAPPKDPEAIKAMLQTISGEMTIQSE